MNPFQKASRSQVFLKLAITGVTGSGKTLSAILLAAGLVELGQRIAFSDTENESASLYSDLTEQQCKLMKIPASQIESVMAASRLFDAASIAPPYKSEDFLTHVQLAVSNGYGALVMDSASHFWKGILAFKDQLDGHGGTNKFTNWKTADAKFDPVIEAVLQSKIHILFCMRSKMSYEIDEQTKKPKKVGLAPIMREMLEYEFTTVFDIGMDHSAIASKDRSGMFPNDKVFTINEETGAQFRAWLKTATPKPEPAPAPIITDDQAKAGNIAKVREILASNRGDSDPIEFESSFCMLITSKIGDEKTRPNLDFFTLEELRGPVWKNRAWAITEIARLAPNGATVA